MISFFRRFFNSRFGIPITLIFLGVIAFAFASSDVANTGTFGGVSGGERVAVVGDKKISTSELSKSASTALDRMRQQNPTISMPAFIEQGGLEQVLEQILDRTAIGEFARKYGLRAGDNLVNSEILAIPAFRGADGNFSQDTYRQAIAQQGMSDADVRDDLGAGLLAQQVLVPASFGARVPDKIVSRYASLLKEKRSGAIGIIPSGVFAPQGAPTDAQLKKFYDDNRGDFIRPERRVIRFATFGEDAVGARAEPTAQEVAARYEENRQQYAPSENRRITQFIVPTQQAANAIRDKVNKGGSLAVSAREAGLDTTELGPLSRQQLASQASAAVAQAVFAADRGAIAQPARSGLGWHVVRVDAIDRVAGRNLDQARGEITAALREEKRRTALSDLAANVEEQLEDGVALADVAKELKLELTTTRPVTGNGAIYGQPGQTAPQELAPVLQTAFQMEEGEPQLAEIQRGQIFMIFETSRITQSATAPLKDIRDDAVAAWRQSEGLKAARAAADRILKRLSSGATLAAAMRQEQKALPPVETINLTREQLAQQGQQVPPPLALLFSMAEGTSKKLEAPQDAGWFVVDLDDIEAGTIAKDDPFFAQAKRELSVATGREYSEQLRRAIREEMGIERNEAAIEAVSKQLTGEN